LSIPVPETLLILGLLAVYPVIPAGASSTVLWVCLGAQYTIVLTSVVRPISIYRSIPTFVTTEFLFQFFAYLIFFYPYQLHVLGIYDVSQSVFFHNTFAEESNQAIVLSLIGTLAFRAGVRALAIPLAPAVGADRRSSRLDEVSGQALALPVLVLQVLFIAVYEAFGWRAAGEGRYSGQVAAGPLVEGVYLAIIVLSMIAVALRVIPSPKETGRSIFLSLAALTAGVWAIRVLLSGDRNAFLLIAIVAIGGAVTFRIRTGRWVLIVLGFIAIPLYSAIEALRSGRIGSVFAFFSSEGSAAASYGGDTSFNISTISIRAALARVPEAIDYGYGLYKLIGAAGVIPFIRGLVVPPGIPHLQSSDVLNDILLGPRARWGVGSNVIADAYLDFGVLAVPVLLFVLGVFVAYVQRAVTRLPDSPWRSVMYLMTLALIAEIPRYSLDFPVRPLVWTLMLFWAISFLSTSVGSQSRQRMMAPPTGR
jgi:oligosaccharide repeat unit polymerase